MFQISISPEEIGRLELASFPGEIHVIDSLGEEFGKAISYLKRQKVIGFDTETRPSPDQRSNGTALLQLSGAEKAFLFRIKPMGGIPRRLCAILANPNIVKVGAAIHDDVSGLQRFAGFQPQNFVDLQKIGWEYGIRDKSVKKMTAIILGFKISKAQQLSNWEAEKLSESQQRYAATDAWVCREMYIKLLDSPKAPLTPEQMENLRKLGVNLGFLTLHVGLGTFRPVKTERIEDHVMHSEYYSIGEDTAKLIRETKAAGKRVVAVGTTSIRTLESAAVGKNEIYGKTGETSIFIYPGFEFKAVDGLITNFHLPKSTLIMLVSAFATKDLIFKAYNHAVEEKYRFFSFGDAMLII